MNENKFSEEQIKMIRNAIDFKQIREMIKVNECPFLLFSMEEDFPELGIRYKSFIVKNRSLIYLKYNINQIIEINNYVRSIEKLVAPKDRVLSNNICNLFPNLVVDSVLGVCEI